MKFLKVLINSMISGLFFAGLLALLTLDININLPFEAAAFGELALALALPYGTIVLVTVLSLFFIVQFFTGKRLAIKAISSSFLAVSFALLIIVFLLILWENMSYFRSFLDAETAGRLRAQAIILAVLAVLAGAALYAARRYKKVFPLTAYFLVFALGLVVAVSQRAKYPAGDAGARAARLEARRLDRNVVLIGLDGLSLDFIFPLIAEGKLPNFSWLVENGTWGRLETISPTESFILNHSLMTGKLPAKHRQLSLNSYRLFYGKYKLDVTPRFILFRQMARLGLLKTLPGSPPRAAKDLAFIIEANGSHALDLDSPVRAAREKPDPRAEKAFSLAFKVVPSERNRLFALARNAFTEDWEREDSAFAEKGRMQPGFFHLLLNGLNTVEAYFYKYSNPEQFGSINQEEISQFGPVISRYYEYYDQIIGKYLASLKDNELLVVYSSFGVEPLPLWKRFVEWILGNADVSAYHEDTPAGVVFFYGQGIEKRNTMEGMKIVDIAPTILYFLGLPVGKDMDGIVQSPVFVREFTAENPIFYIGSYEETEIESR
jgi:hypothetical protein